MPIKRSQLLFSCVLLYGSHQVLKPTVPVHRIGLVFKTCLRNVVTGYETLNLILINTHQTIWSNFLESLDVIVERILPKGLYSSAGGRHLCGQ